MEYRSVGRAGCMVSPLRPGTMLFGGDTPADEAYDIVDRAIDAGNNVIDTANVYHNHACEQVLGQALKRNGERELIPFAQSYGFGIIPWSPLAGGFLTGECLVPYYAPDFGPSRWTWL